MKFKDTEIENIQLEFQALDEITEDLGFYYAWDYERVTFDYKIVDLENVYYLRVPAHVVEGEIPNPTSTVKMMTPYLGRHYYPHGVEYDEDFPQKIIAKCESKLEKLYAGISKEIESF